VGVVFLTKFGFDRSHLAALEVGDLNGAPALGGADHGAEHELEHWLLAEGIGMIFSRLRSSTNRRSRRLVVRIARRG
jgi:hypothetical protein